MTPQERKATLKSAYAKEAAQQNLTLYEVEELARHKQARELWHERINRRFAGNRQGVLEIDLLLARIGYRVVELKRPVEKLEFIPEWRR